MSQQNQLRQSYMNHATPVRMRSESGESHKDANDEDLELFSPVIRPGAKRSYIWAYGGCKKDENGKLIRDKIYCGICSREFKYTGTGGNFLTHLKNLHSVTGFTNKPQYSTVTVKIDSVFLPKQDSKYRNDNAKQKKFRTLACKWIVKNTWPLTIMEDQAFRDMIEHADPKLTVPCSSTVTREIRKMYTVQLDKTIELFKELPYFWGTTDAGTSYGGKTFIDVNAHYITSDFKMKKKILTVLGVTSKKSKDYKDRVIEAYKLHGIKDKVFGITTDNEKTMEVTFDQEFRNGCLSHLDSKACQYALESSETLQRIRSKLRKVAKKANKSSKFKGNIQKEQLERSEPENFETGS